MIREKEIGPTVLHADKEHEGLRAVLILLLLVLLFGGYWLINYLLKLEPFSMIRDYSVSISCGVSLVLALAISTVFEMVLKRYWHSGHSLAIDDAGIVIKDRQNKDRHIRWSGAVSNINWFFNLSGYRRGGREKRLSGKWVCLATKLQQDDTRLIVYSYLPPNKAQPFLLNEDANHKFHEIKQAEVHEAGFFNRMAMPARPTIPNEVITGKNGRYWLAERHRWEEGLELTSEDFTLLMNRVQSQ